MKESCVSRTLGEISHNTRIKIYPDGTQKVLCCSSSCFKEKGWESRKGNSTNVRESVEDVDEACVESLPSERAARRAREHVRDLALCTAFTHFVTLTLDGAHIDRYDMSAITRKLNAWLSNQVQRRGLAYILVPERHKDGAIHFHGLFNDVLERSDSGTIIPPGGGKPRKPRSKPQRAAWLADGGRVVWNLPGWSLGFTTALELVGDYSKAVGYVCKYIGKQGDKPGGRWYYSGGDLRRPAEFLADLDYHELRAMPGAYEFSVLEARRSFVSVTLTPEQNGDLTFFGL